MSDTEDYLDADHPIPGQSYVCLSFISPDEIMKHKDDYLEKYAHIVKMNNLNAAKRPKKVIEKFETLQTYCKNFDKFSESERKENLFKYLGLFSRRDAIPDEYFEDSDDPETVTE